MSKPPNYALASPSTLNLLCSADPTSSNVDQTKVEVKKYAKKDLYRLLAFMEAELQAKDVALAVAKAEKAKAYLYKQPEGAEGKVMQSLLSDEGMTIQKAPNSQLEQIFSLPHKEHEKLFLKYKEVENRLASRLFEVEERHKKEIKILESQLKRHNDTKGNNESKLVATLQQHVKSLTAETSRKQSEIEQRDEEISRRDADLKKEQERAKVIILYMLHERKQLLSQLHQLQMRVKMAGPDAEQHENILVAELKKQVAQLIDEKSHLQRVMDEQQNDKAVLVNIVRGLEDEINSLKEPQVNVPKKGNETPKSLPGYVVANKNALSGDVNSSKPRSPNYNSNYTGTVVRRGSPTKYRIHNSATFPNNTVASPPKTPLNGNTRYNEQHTPVSNLPRPSMGMSARHQPPLPNSRPPIQRQSRPTMGVAVQDYQNSTAIPVEQQKGMGLVQRFMRRSTSLPKRINNNEVVEQAGRVVPPQTTPGTPPSPGGRKTQQMSLQRPQRLLYDNGKSGHTRIQ
ncbi:unnamed protein product [Bursaphelenchus okinawaensis]|uniref:Cortactin-binding protein-2 N-terminal domain-containing protein n=1 Tax=Bursaphelenchus okinawaensis TaxID=465554 RepID=A0A811KPJ9_9BILA|nr:unnamed protein product [Bursaphelenchus okinawaensis]CAG9109307.1 unnamed protein product [Bursaphelenchus okinawaensis]